MISSSTAQSFHAGWETLVLGVCYENVELNRYDVSGLKGFSVLSAVFFHMLARRELMIGCLRGHIP
jgi:hypothetical protein